MIISPVKAAEAAALLGIDLTMFSAEDLTRAYRAKAKECHPDHHADKSDEWARLSWANECLKHWLERRGPAEVKGHELPQCERCEGTGRLRVKKLVMFCPNCKGQGTLEAEENDGD